MPTMNDVACRLPGDAELFGEMGDLLSAGATPSDFKNLIRRELAEPVPLTKDSATTGVLVSTVVEVRSAAQVPGIAADRVITRMQNVNAFSDRAARQRKGYPVSPYRVRLAVDAAGGRCVRRATISPWLDLGLPGPAFIVAADVHVAPEPARESWSGDGCGDSFSVTHGDLLGVVVLGARRGVSSSSGAVILPRRAISRATGGNDAT